MIVRYKYSLENANFFCCQKLRMKILTNETLIA